MNLARLTLLAVAALLLAPGVADAATLRLVHEAGSREIGVVLDTEGAAVNAVEGTIDLPGGAAGVRLGDSVVPLWLERPSASSLRFSGVIPGGFEGEAGVLFTIAAAGSGEVTATPRDVRAYRNDGAGTPLETLAVPLRARLPAGPAPAFGAGDTDVPDFSEIRVARDPALFGGRWFAVWNAQDATTGVARYEIAERAGPDTGDTEGLLWRPATSPAELQDQSRRSTVFVRAQDGVGNARIAHVGPAATPGANPYAQLGFGALLALLIAAAVIVRKARLRA